MEKTCPECGLLCRPCNTAIGQLQESEDVIQKALEYVRGFNG